MKDKTSELEQILTRDPMPRTSHLLKLWKFIFGSTKGISIIYLSLFLLVTVFRLALAFVWEGYVDVLENKPQYIFMALLLLTAYWAMSFAVSLLDSYLSVEGDGDLEQLDAVQANRQQETMHTKIYKKLSSVSPEYFEVATVNDLTDRVFSFVDNCSEGMNRGVMLKSYVVIAKTISLLGIVGALYFFSPSLCALVLLAPLPILWTTFVSDRLAFRFQVDHSQLRRRIRYWQKLFLGKEIREIRAFGIYDYFYSRWKADADAYTFAEREKNRKMATLNVVSCFVINAVQVSGSVIAIAFMINGRLDIAAAGAVISLFHTVLSDVSQLFAGASSLFSKKYEASQFHHLMELPEQTSAGQSTCAFLSLTLSNVCYRYPLTHRLVLKDIDLAIRKGERIAIVGANGEGKSTLVKLLLGVIQPSSGTVLYNGVSDDQLSAMDRYKQQSVVLQDPQQYKTLTVAQAVSLGRTEAPPDTCKMQYALNFAGLEHLDSELRLGKDVGGTDLSGGQWQRVAIARAQYRNGDFIVLDEPTGSLDPIAETEVFQKYLDLTADKTVVFVTHRISMAALAQRILVIDRGQIVEDGSHQDLLSRNGMYAKLYRDQAQWYER